MSDHDPLCPGVNDQFGCWCDALAQARTDERERIAVAIERLDRLTRWLPDGSLDDVLAVIRGGRQ